jgi:hypothetical protein
MCWNFLFHQSNTRKTGFGAATPEKTSTGLTYPGPKEHTLSELLLDI